MRKLLCALALAALLAACSDGTSAESREWDLRINAQMAVRAKLKDPSSAEFGKIWVHRGADSLTVACGWVNAKNGFGGYGGAQRFISMGVEDGTFLEEQMETGDFGPSWDRFCVR